MKLIEDDNGSTIAFNNKITIKKISNDVHNYKFANYSLFN